MFTASPTAIISHWNHLIEFFEVSPQAFYQSLEAAIQRREVPDIELSRVEHREGGFLTARREYLRIRRGNHNFDICAAPFGKGFFVSWWLVSIPSILGFLCFLGIVFGMLLVMSLFFKAGIINGLLLTIFVMPILLLLLGIAVHEGALGSDETVLATPVFGWLYMLIFQPATYYKLDTAAMFQQSVHNAVLEVIDEMTSAQGIRKLTELERKPIFRADALR